MYNETQHKTVVGVLTYILMLRFVVMKMSLWFVEGYVDGCYTDNELCINDNIFSFMVLSLYNEIKMMMSLFTYKYYVYIPYNIQVFGN